MKTTVEIPDTILEEAKKVAARQRMTLRALIIEGLRRIIAERKRPGEFRLRKANFRRSQNAMLIVTVTPCVMTLPDEFPTNVPEVVVPEGPLGLVNVPE